MSNVFRENVNITSDQIININRMFRNCLLMKIHLKKGLASLLLARNIFQINQINYQRKKIKTAMAKAGGVPDVHSK